MSSRTKEINKITGMIISISAKLILYAVVALLLVEGVTKGYAFGYEVFNPSPMAAAPGVDKVVTIDSDSAAAVSAQLRKLGLIPNETVFIIQDKFYDYQIHPGTYTLNTSMTSKEILQALNENPDDEDEKS